MNYKIMTGKKGQNRIIGLIEDLIAINIINLHTNYVAILL